MMILALKAPLASSPYYGPRKSYYYGHLDTAVCRRSALRSISSYSACGSDRATTAPPAPMATSPLWNTAVRMTMLRSKGPLTEKYPMQPEYTPRGRPSSVSMMSIVRTFGAPATGGTTPSSPLVSARADDQCARAPTKEIRIESIPTALPPFRAQAAQDKCVDHGMFATLTV
eukprot:587-Prorocentrum_minimum.AAC.6